MSSSSGIHDPYWYEATVGQEYLLKMFDDQLNIESVTFQKTAATALDDVVVKFASNKKRCVQVKHSRVDTKFTFSTLFMPLKDSLFSNLLIDWLEESTDGLTEVTLFTNRELGDQDSTVEILDEKIQVPSLESCLHFLKNCKTLESDDDKIKNLIKIIKLSLKNIPDDKVIEFLKLFEIKFSQPDLKEYKNIIQRDICKIFGCSASGAELIHSKLDHALRKWATTDRGRYEEVTREIVLKELSMIEDEQVGQHEIPPPSPFFKSRHDFSAIVENQIEESRLSHFFIEGDAGSGKSSVVSYLCNRPEPAFDLRFHAFLPLQASGLVLPLDSEKTVTPKVFWQDLLIQLKRKLKGDLSKYNLPVISSHLEWNDIRNYVLSTLEEIAKNEKRFVSIVIDGIDHAARSKIEITFLETIPPPSINESKIKFVLVGQSPEAYPQYPIWLKETRKDVLRFTIPQIEVEDIEALLSSKKDLKINLEDVRTVAVIIQSKVMGNTLSAVFAVEETLSCQTIEEVEACLDDRKLTGNLSAYYEEIWNSTLDKISSNKQSVGAALALVFSTFKTRITPEFLCSALDDFELNIYEWKNIFKNLGPLIIEDKLGFRVLHNDVRIFLIGFTNLNTVVVTQIANKLSLFLETTKEYDLIKQNDLINLIIHYGDREKLKLLINDKFIFDGFVVHKNEDQIHDEFFDMIRYQSKTDFDVKNILNCMLVSKTIQSVDSSMSAYEIPKKTIKNFDGSFLKSECKVPRKDLWNLEIIEKLLEDCRLLHATNNINRAKDLFDRWFEYESDLSFIEKLDEDDVYERWGGEDDKRYKKEFLSIIKEIGFYSLCFDRWDMFEKSLGLRELSKGILHATMVSGGVRAIVAHEKYNKKIVYLLREARTYFLNDFEYLIEKKFISGSYNVIRYLVNFFNRRGKDLPLNLLVILSTSETLLGMKDNFTNKLLEHDFISSNWKKEDVKDSEKYLIYLTILYSYKQKHRPIQGIIDDVLKMTDYKNFEAETIKALRQLMYLSGLISRSLIIVSDKPGLYFDLNETSTLLTYLLKNSSSNTRAYIRDKHHIVEVCIELLSCGSKNLSANSFNKIESLIINFLSDEKYYWTKQWLIKFLLRNGNKKAVKLELDLMFSKTSDFWTSNPSDRFDFLKFLESIENSFNEIDVEELNRKSRIGLFYPSSHKDYTLIELEEALEIVLLKHPERWKTIGLEALKVSSIYDKMGDNRLHRYIKKLLLRAAVKCSVKDFNNLINLKMNEERVFDINDPILIECLISALEEPNFSENDLIFIWEFCRSLLPYGQDGTTEDLIKLKVRFKEIILEKGFSNLNSLLENDKWIEFLDSVTNNKDEFKKEVQKNEELKEVSEFKLLFADVDDYSRKSNDFQTEGRDEFKRNLSILLSSTHLLSKAERDEYIIRMRDVLISFRRRYSFKNSGLSSLVEKLASIMTLNELENFYFSFLEHFLESERLSFWPDILREDFKTFLFAFMHKLEIDDYTVNEIIRNTKNLIDAFDANPVNEVKIDLDNEESNRWEDFYFNHILNYMESPFADLQLESWKSFSRVIFLFPDYYDVLLSDWEKLSEDVKVKVLGILELSKWSNSDFFHRYSKSFIKKVESLDESVEVRAILSIISKADNSEDFEFVFLNHNKFKKLPVGPDRLLSYKDRQLGLSSFTNEFSTFKLKIRMAQFVFDDLDVDLIEKEVSRLRAVNEENIDSRYYRGLNSIDLFKNENLNLLNEAVENEVSSGKSTPMSNTAFIQMILNGDDPNFLKNEGNFIHFKYSFDNLKLYESNDKKTQDEFMKEVGKCMESFLEGDEKILSSTVNLYSDSYDYIIKIDTVLDDKNLYALSIDRPVLFGGRGAYLSSPYHVGEIQEDNYFVVEYGGLFKFQKMSFVTYPKNSFTEKLGLQRVNDNPFELVNSISGARLKFQRINLYTKEKVRTPYFRMSYVDQWVMNEQLKNEIFELYKKDTITVSKVKSAKYEN